jgi:hypothetical protein
MAGPADLYKDVPEYRRPHARRSIQIQLAVLAIGVTVMVVAFGVLVIISR